MCVYFSFPSYTRLQKKLYCYDCFLCIFLLPLLLLLRGSARLILNNSRNISPLSSPLHPLSRIAHTVSPRQFPKTIYLRRRTSKFPDWQTQHLPSYFTKPLTHSKSYKSFYGNLTSHAIVYDLEAEFRSHLLFFGASIRVLTGNATVIPTFQGVKDVWKAKEVASVGKGYKTWGGFFESKVEL